MRSSSLARTLALTFVLFLVSASSGARAIDIASNADHDLGVVPDEYIVVTTDGLTTMDAISVAFGEVDSSKKRRLRGSGPRIVGQEIVLQNGEEVEEDDVTPDMVAASSLDSRFNAVNNIMRKASSGKRKRTRGGKKLGLVAMSSADREMLLKVPGVVDVVPNGRTRVGQLTPAPMWNLDRIDQAIGMDGGVASKTRGQTGAGVDIYIVDTGVNAAHETFTGRVQTGRNFLSLMGIGSGGDSDCHSHGTHVASTAAGVGFGTATDSVIIPVKVMDCDGTGSVFNLVAGITYARDEAVRKGSSRKAVINVSISTGPAPIVDEAVQSAVAQNVVVVVAAGNYRSDACHYSPAREPSAITVGATSKDDSFLSLSNRGGCVDIYAPGEQIMGAGNAYASHTMVKSGTSMAAPLVAGVAALIREKNPGMNVAAVRNELLRLSTTTQPTMDFDCGDRQAGYALLRTYEGFAREIPTLPSRVNMPLFTARGEALDSDFRYWVPELAFSGNQAGGEETCFAFSAKVTANRNNAEVDYAAMRIMVSQRELPLGISAYSDTPSSCKDALKWFILEAGPRSTSILSERGLISKTDLPAIVGTLSKTQSREFYFSLKRSGSGVVASLGRGDGVSRDSTVLHSAVHPNFVGSPSDFRRFSFSAQTAFDIEYTNVRPCGPASEGGRGEDSTAAPTPAQTKAPTVATKAPTVATKAPTPLTKAPTAPTLKTSSPTLAPTQGLGPVVKLKPLKVNLTKKQAKGLMNRWPAPYNGPCIQFEALINRAVLVGLSTQPAIAARKKVGKTKVLSLPNNLLKVQIGVVNLVDSKRGFTDIVVWEGDQSIARFEGNVALTSKPGYKSYKVIPPTDENPTLRVYYKLNPKNAQWILAAAIPLEEKYWNRNRFSVDSWSNTVSKFRAISRCTR